MVRATAPVPDWRNPTRDDPDEAARLVVIVVSFVALVVASVFMFVCRVVSAEALVAASELSAAILAAVSVAMEDVVPASI
jgi:hypothetical protein